MGRLVEVASGCFAVRQISKIWISPTGRNVEKQPVKLGSKCHRQPN